MNPMSGGMNPMMGGMTPNMGMQGKFEPRTLQQEQVPGQDECIANRYIPGQGGFQTPNPAFNQPFFSPNQGVGDGQWNPHGAKRSRQE